MQIDRIDVKSEAAFDLFASFVNDLNNLKNWIVNGVQVHGGFAQATTTTRFKTSAATNYTINGQNYTKGTTDNIATPNGNTSAGQFRKDLISIDAAGTITVTAGTVAASQGAAVKPACPANQVELGWIEVPASFTAGTTDVTAGMLKQVVRGNDLTLETTIGS